MYLRRLIHFLIFMFILMVTCGNLFAEFGNTLYFTYQIGGTLPSPQYQSIVSATPGRETAGNAVRTSGQSWLQAYISSSTTPFTLTVGVNPMGLAAGNYFGTVQLLCSTCAQTLDFDVNLTVTNPPPPLTASPSSLIFNAVQGSSAPPFQTLVIGALISAGSMITCDSTVPNWLNTGWINIGNAPMRITLSINPSFSSLNPGTYMTSLHFTAPFSSQQVTVPITLNVSAPPPVLKTNVNQLRFQYVMGDPVPAVQAIQVTSSGTPLTTSVSMNAAWLTASALSGTTPFVINLGVNPGGLAVGTYGATVSIVTSFGAASSSSQTVDVTLSVAPDTRPVITSVVNAASFKSVIGPSAWISIMGSNLSPTPMQQSVPLPISMNGVSAELRGAGGVYSLMLNYVSSTQINAFVPQELPLTFLNSTCSIAITVPTGVASMNTTCQGLTPALFSYGSQNYAAARHLDGSVIGVIAGTRPAQNGEIISIWGTGFGQTAPPVANVNSLFMPQPLANPIEVYVGGQSVQVLWAGMTGTGLDQFNIQLPNNLTSGDAPISMKIIGTETERVLVPVR